MSTEEGIKIIENGWKASGILGAVKDGSAGLEPIDPFQEISPLPSTPPLLNTNVDLPESDVLDDFVNEQNDDDDEDSEWEDDDIDFERNAFSFIIDDELDL